MNKNTNNPTGGHEYWMSLEQYAGDTEFAKRAESEFMSSPLANEDGKDGFARREFLKLMGASIALASTACIRRPVQKIIPYAKAPLEVTPGIPNFYASTWFDGIEGYGTLVKTVDGRPIKLEGNPLHPMNLGGLNARAHAEVLSLYDPDRLRGPVRNLPNKTRTNKETISAKWDDVDTKVEAELAKGGVAILSSTLPSPSTRALIADFTKAYPGTRWVQYDTMSADSVCEGQKRSFGKAVVPRLRFDKAKMIVAIDTDFLGTYLSPAEFMKQWSKGRKPGAEMSRMVSFESIMTLTGMNADDRYRIKPSQQLDVVMAILNAVAKAGGAVPPAIASYLKNYDGAAQGLGLDGKVFDKLAHELLENKGKSLVVAGGMQTETADALDLQVAVNFLNSVLGNDGATIDHDVAPFETRQGSGTELASLIKDMQDGKVKTLIIHGLNPAYALPKDAGFTEAIAKVDFVVSTSNRNDETGGFANYVLPSGNSLESWGDYELQTGVYSIQQPTIRPLYDTRSFNESLLVWTKASKGAPARAAKAKDWFEYLTETWKSDVHNKSAEGKGKSFDEFWAVVLQQGVVSVAGDRRDQGGHARSFQTGSIAQKQRQARSGYELVLYSTQQMGDGHYANVPWLQELPDLITKVVWDNYLSVSPATARKENLKQEEVVTLHVGDKKLNVPVLIQPGLHDDVLSLSVGYGRSNPGKVGKDIGFNAYELASFAGGNSIYSGAAVTLSKTGERHQLVSTQTHHSLNDVGERQIVVETTNAAFQKNPSSGIKHHKVFSIWPTHKYTRHRWAMTIDLNSCTGCSACVMACQSENNVPVVGKRYVHDGREMHWIRIDRYYRGSDENPDVAFMPLACQQCENAPCETVCPVLATVHNDEGLNDMVYNRCVGTRYCSNNCPYKVRRFNWFNYSKREEPTHLALNPEVTVRSRGVMEKCTFCVQRIRHATSAGKGNPLVDGTLKTACQQTCPTDAITFGDLADPNSAVSKLFVDARSYSLLEELNTVPRVRFQSRIRNSEREVEEDKDVEVEDGPKKEGLNSQPGQQLQFQQQFDNQGERV
jgi:molybdopterin-containing oxidoreductase family iron-sulfur binding subunit